MKKDSAVTPESPTVRVDLPIEGVVLQRPRVVEYEYGNLVELFRPEWPGVFASGEAPGHLYFIDNPQHGGRGEWHKHDLTVDRYSVVKGILELILWDSRDGSASKDVQMSVVLEAGSRDRYSMARIPAGVWHTIIWKTVDGGVLLNAKDPAFVHADPDKYRLAFETKAPEPGHYF